MKNNSIAVLVTCYNRKEKTLNCLNRLFNITTNIDVYLVDDGCTDGTSDEIEKYYNFVKIIKSRGDLFWSRGMNLAWENASVKNYNFYLWLNDDVFLYDNFLDEMFDSYVKSGKKAIIAGVVESDDRKEILYGGYDINKKIINPNGFSKGVHYMNGNVVLISKDIFNVLGNLDPFFYHDLGDVDYGFRAKKCNIDVLSTKIPIASGEKNHICRERKFNVDLISRFEYLYSPLGSSPFINFYFRKRHFGYFNAAIYFVFQHFLNIIPDKLNIILFSDKYK